MNRRVFLVAGRPIISAYTRAYLMGGGRAPATASAASVASSTPCADLDGEEGLTAAGPRPVVLLGGGGMRVMRGVHFMIGVRASDL